MSWFAVGVAAMLIAAAPVSAGKNKGDGTKAERRAAAKVEKQDRQAQRKAAESQQRARREAQKAAEERAKQQRQAEALAAAKLSQRAARNAQYVDTRGDRARAEIDSRRAVRANSDRHQAAAAARINQRDRHDDHRSRHVPSHDKHPNGRDKNNDGVHDHFDHHVKNPSNALKHSHKKHHDDHDDRRYGSSHRYPYPYYRGGVYRSTYGHCSHGYTYSSCHVCNPHYGYHGANRATVIIRSEPVVERTTTVVESVPQVVEPTPEPEPTVEYVNGWQLLRGKDATGALEAFEDAIRADPNTGIHRIGYAVAAALLGEDDKAVPAMRDVVRFAPGSMIEAPLDGEVTAYYDALIARYQAREDTDLARADDPFMIAAIAYLKQDFALAHASVRNAARVGDVDPAVPQLATMIDYQRNYTRQP